MQNDRIIIASFNPFDITPITPAYIRSLGDATYPMKSGDTILTNNYGHLYIGGAIDGDLALFKFNANDGSAIFEVTTEYTDGTHKFALIASLDIIEGGGTNY